MVKLVLARRSIATNPHRRAPHRAGPTPGRCRATREILRSDPGLTRRQPGTHLHRAHQHLIPVPLPLERPIMRPDLDRFIDGQHGRGSRRSARMDAVRRASDAVVAFTGLDQHISPPWIRRPCNRTMISCRAIFSSSYVLLSQISMPIPAVFADQDVGEIRVVERMVLGLHGEPVLIWLVGRFLPHRRHDKHPVVFERKS